MAARQIFNTFRTGLILIACAVGGNLRADPESEWQALIGETRAPTMAQTVIRVNHRINTIRKISDQRNWQLADYWATPWETLARGGDCEDLAIAKYYLLREHGVPESRLRMLFTRMFNSASGRIEAHMVLLYHPEDEDETEPRVLDNLRNDVLALSYRRDLIPTAAFDRHDYWIYRDGTWNAAKKAASIRSWNDLQQRWRTQQRRQLAVAALADL